jgi:hypothetical protein
MVLILESGADVAIYGTLFTVFLFAIGFFKSR